MKTDRMLDALYETVDKAFAQKRYAEVDKWIGQLDIDWLFKKYRSMLCGWMVTSSWASRRGIKMPNREKLSKRCRELMPHHKQWWDNLDRVDNGGEFAYINLCSADVAHNPNGINPVVVSSVVIQDTQ